VLNNYSSFYKHFNQLITLYLKIVFETLVLRKVIFLKENNVLLMINFWNITYSASEVKTKYFKLTCIQVVNMNNDSAQNVR